MIRPRPRPVHAIDLFCGGGGTTTGIERAYDAAGRPVTLLGINHDELACQTHARNHSRSRTLCQRLQHIPNPRSLIPNGYAHLIAASAECRAHTKASNGSPRDDQSRSTMDEIIRFLQAFLPDLFFGENVPEVLLWGPLLRNGRQDPKHLGLFFEAWAEHVRRIGYTNLEWRTVCCASYGDPTFRTRLIIMGSRDGAPVRWPAPTHGPVGSGLLPYRTTREIIEWRIRGTLIGEKRRAGYFTHRRERWACIEAGLALYGGAPFVLRRRQHDNSPESNAKSVDEPLHTVTTKSTDIALIVPDGPDIDRARHRMLLPIELQRAMSFPDDYVFMGETAGAQVHQIGNAVPVRTAYAHVAALLGLPKATHGGQSRAA